MIVPSNLPQTVLTRIDKNYSLEDYGVSLIEQEGKTTIDTIQIIEFEKCEKQFSTVQRCVNIVANENGLNQCFKTLIAKNSVDMAEN